MGRKLRSKPLDGEGMRRRVEAALRKAEREEKLTTRELMIVQWVTRPGGCRVCSTAVRVSRGGGAGW
ncbi:MAG: hypothetical protein AVDCRST_MAG78-1685 [uncultured Rubrobacteraceae bacterium]|uniref:Uncharacterized protein n=1 Tax=uncultured Rubrobacteraceae bacterium TaxID=349277 RepID=A0A6J4Q5E5_9ACTN|nr:MAG: hypothetical protein AVDCRST_MAG78-1685 [uncultured Rubrobacteraceae bacterium]